MAVIALTSSMGTGVKYVAEQVAQRLGMKLVYREICDIARSPETAAPRIQPSALPTRWENGLAYLHSQRQMAALIDLEDLYRLVQRDSIVICGNTPLHFLSEVTEVVKIRVRTTMALRVRRIMACMNTDESESALAKILHSDQRQAETLRRLFQIEDSENPELYDSVVDTGREPTEDCALKIIGLALMKARDPRGIAAEKLDFAVAQVRSARIRLLDQETDDLTGGSLTRRQSAETGDLNFAAGTAALATRLPV